MRGHLCLSNSLISRIISKCVSCCYWGESFLPASPHSFLLRKTTLLRNYNYFNMPYLPGKVCFPLGISKWIQYFPIVFISSSQEEKQTSLLGVLQFSTFSPNIPINKWFLWDSQMNWDHSYCIFCPLGNDFHNYIDIWTVCYLEKTRLWAIKTNKYLSNQWQQKLPNPEFSFL